MSRAIHRLSAASLRLKQPGYYADGGGLWLQVTAGKAGQVNRSWIFRYVSGPRTREMGLGSVVTIGLADARAAALECRKQRVAGLDPIEHRNAQRAVKAAAEAKVISFDQCADRFIEAHRPGWRSAKHAAQWPATLGKYVSPIFGKQSVAAVDTTMVLQVLEPLWMRAPETANRLRGRIEQILDWAIARGYREAPNPAAWRGHLKQLLPSHRKLKRVVHHPALPYTAVPDFLSDLRKREGASARALEFLVLTTARSAEVIGAQWSEIDLSAGLWTIPAGRMKGHRDHRVPLSPRCLAILQEMMSVRQGDYVFPGRNGTSPLWVNSFGYLLEQLGRGDVTAHGFRSSFRDWCGEATNFPREIAEAALGHQIGSAVEQAYRRGDALAKRRKLMEGWEAFCRRPAPAGATVLKLHMAGADA